MNTEQPQPKYTQQNPLVVVLPNSRWARGINIQANKLLGEDKRQCCIGLACSVLGIPDAILLGRSALTQLFDVRLPAPLNKLEQQRKAAGRLQSKLANAYRGNDDATFTDIERVAYINQNVNPFGLHFVFDPEG